MNITFTGTPPEVLEEIRAFLGVRGSESEPAAPKDDKPDAAQAETPKEEETSDGRMYGKTEVGKARRTTVQIAEDEEIETLAAKLGANLDGAAAKHPASDILEQLRAQSETAPADESAGISTGEERSDPEQEEGATRDDVRDAMGRYVEKHGMPAIQKNGPELLGYAKLSEIPEDPALFAAAAARLDAATADD